MKNKEEGKKLKINVSYTVESRLTVLFFFLLTICQLLTSKRIKLYTKNKLNKLKMK